MREPATVNVSLSWNSDCVSGPPSRLTPTETLAEQHFLTLEEPCRELGVEVALLTRSVKDDPGAAQILVGTHALIQEGVDLSEVAVAVVDEQHRFGVEQRRAITGGKTPHVLHMTATPIPRTLALTVYGDLTVSEIAKPPANRKPVKTASAYQKAIRESGKGKSVLFLVRRGDNTIFLALKPPG